MMIDLDLRRRTVVVIGGGRQAERRVESLLQEECGRIIVMSADVSSEKIREWSQKGDLHLLERDVRDESFIDDCKPDVLIAATDSPAINAMAVRAAQSANILAYCSDDAGLGDFSHPAVVRLDGGITVAVSTGGQSPAVSKYVRQKAQGILRSVITPRLVAQVRIQDMVRKKARYVISAQSERKRLLDEIMSDGAIDRLIRDGRLKDAEERAMSMLSGGRS